MAAGQEYMETVERIAQGVVRNQASDIDQQGRWPELAFQELKAARLTGLNAPVECGGMGRGTHDLALVCEALGRECSSTAICFGMHCVATAVIAANASDEHRLRYLEPIAKGIHLTTLSLSEPGSGGFFFFPQTRIKSTTSGYSVNGEKHFVTNGGHADSYVVSGRSISESDVSEDFSCVVIDAAAPGIAFGGQWTGIGMRGNSSLTMSMANVEIPDTHLLGRIGDQTWYIFQVVTPYFLLAMAGTYLGLARRAFDEALAHVKQRVLRHNGSALADAPVIQHRIGEMWGHLNQSRESILAAALQFDAQSGDALLPLLATKANVAECAVNIVNQALTLCGGIGYRRGAVLERLLRDVRACDVMAPTTDLLRIWTGRALLDQPLLGG